MAITRGSSTSGIKSFLIPLIIGTATNTNGIKVYAKNRRTKDYRIWTTDDNGEVVLNAGNLTSDGTDSGTHTPMENSDQIEIKLQGDALGSAVYTIATTGGAGSGSPITITGTDFTATTTPGRTY